MGDVIISQSILGYADNLEANIDSIRDLIDNKADALHIDIMRRPFTPQDAFPEKAIKKILDMSIGLTNLDFHIMSYTPDQVIDFIDSIYAKYPEERSRAVITIHREAYREKMKGYEAKNIDWHDPDTGDENLDHTLRWGNMRTSVLLKMNLLDISSRGFRSGIALEPEISLQNLTPEIISSTDLILPMGVSSGAGGQQYRSTEVTPKISEARRSYGQMMIQVDGGVNQTTLDETVRAGADNLVIGSYITGAENPGQQLRKIRDMINRIDTRAGP